MANVTGVKGLDQDDIRPGGSKPVTGDPRNKTYFNSIRVSLGHLKSTNKEQIQKPFI